MSRKKNIYFICDRCGAHFENETKTKVFTATKRSLFGNGFRRVGVYFENSSDTWRNEYDKVDLCGKCAESFMKWWENGE